MAKYYTCIIPFVETDATEWHPTDRNFAPLSRGAFQTEEKAHEWATEKIPGAAYTVKVFPCADCDKMHEGACGAHVSRKRSGLSTDRAHKVQEMLRARISDIYSSARHFHSTHEYILGEMSQRVWNAPELKRCPARVSAYLMAHTRALADEIYRRDLVWMLALDGKLVNRTEVDARTVEEERSGANKKPGYKSPWSRIDGDHSAHVWEATGVPYDSEKRVYWREAEEKRKTG